MRDINIKFMKIAKDEAVLAREKGEIPVGAVIVKNGQIISRAHNCKETMKDVTAHAEVLAIKRASNFLGDWRLNGCELYVTLEPCPMCASAIFQSRISKVYIGTFNKDMGACGSVINLLDNTYFNTFTATEWLYDEECSNILSEFFEKQRTKSR